jgi:hypothetical protein
MMKLDSTDANVIFEKCQYKCDVKNALKVIKSDNIYDIFKRIDEVYESKKHNKNTFTFFQHIKSAYENMTDVQKELVSAEQVEALKKYSRKTFYTNRSETESQQLGYESEEEISEEDSNKDKERLDVLNRRSEDMRKDVEMKSEVNKTQKIQEVKTTHHEVMTESLKKTDAQVKYLTEQIEIQKKTETERVEIQKKTDAQVKYLTEQMEGLKKANDIIMSLLDYMIKGKEGYAEEALSMMTRKAISQCFD